MSPMVCAMSLSPARGQAAEGAFPAAGTSLLLPSRALSLILMATAQAQAGGGPATHELQWANVGSPGPLPLTARSWKNQCQAPGWVAREAQGTFPDARPSLSYGSAVPHAPRPGQSPHSLAVTLSCRV